MGGACRPTYDLRVVGEGFGLARLVVRLPLQLDEDGRRLLQVLVSILRSLEDDGELMANRPVYSVTNTVALLLAYMLLHLLLPR